MNQHDDFLKHYLLATARQGDTILFEPPSWFLCAAAPNPAGFVVGTLVSWNMTLVTLQIPISTRGWQWITIPSSWVSGFPLRLSCTAGSAAAK
jgi:hypothetical protein